jgi:type II secretory pathway component PulF
MAIYEYTAVDQNQHTFSGIYTNIDGVKGLREELAKMDYRLLKAKRKISPLGKQTKIKQAEVITFTYRFAGMCSAGVSIAQSLKTLEEQADNPAFKYVISDIRQNIEKGSTLKNAFEKYRRVFSDFLLGMVEAGESSGRLSESLEASADYLEKRAELKHAVRAAFAHPIVIGIVCMVVIVGLTIFVVPVFSKMYRQIHAPLPWPTQALMNLSFLVRHWWWAIIAVAAALILGLRQLVKNPYVEARWDVFKLNMPLFAKLNRMIVVAHFIRTFATLVSTGVSLVKALQVASEVVHNSKISQITSQLQASIESGNSVAGSLKNYDIFPPMIVQLAASGEETGLLSEMLNKGVDFLERDINRMINALVGKLEPAMTIIMGIMVGFALIAVYLPMFSYMTYLNLK